MNVFEEHYAVVVYGDPNRQSDQDYLNFDVNIDYNTAYTGGYTYYHDGVSYSDGDKLYYKVGTLTTITPTQASYNTNLRKKRFINNLTIDLSKVTLPQDLQDSLSQIHVKYLTLFGEQENKMISNYSSLLDRYDFCTQVTSTNDGFRACRSDAPYYNNLTLYNNELIALNQDLINALSNVIGEMIRRCIPCDQIKSNIEAYFGDVLDSNFLTDCEAKVPEHCKLIETDCCILVCCYPDKYRLKGVLSD